MHRRLLFHPHCALRWLLCFLALAGASVALASSGDPAAPANRTLDVTHASAGPLTLTPWFDVLEDPSGALSFEQIRSPDIAARFTPSGRSGTALNFGITPSAWWLRLRLTNPGDGALDRLLEVAYARLSHLDFYAPQSDGTWQHLHTGTTQPFDSRGYAHRNFVFGIALPAHAEPTIYLRIASTTAFVVPARLWEPAAFHAFERSDYAAQAWYFGMVGAMVLFNLLLFLRLRDWLYLQYVGFALSVAFAMAAQNGLVKELLQLRSPLWSDLCTSFGYCFSIASGTLFMRRMVEAPRLLPRLDPWLKGFIAFYFLSPFLFLVTGQALIKPMAVGYKLAIAVVLSVAAYSAWLRQRSAYFFLAAFTLVCLGAAVYALHVIGLMPTNLLTANAIQLGSTLEMILLALALADRFIQMRRERAAMQKTMIDTLRHSEQRLQERVAERTMALEEANRRLEALSRTDGLTGLANRRHFDEVLASEWARSQRSGAPLALAMIDIDWFKAYNDHFGHLGGDDCLRSVAGLLAKCAARSSDLVARYGGEEFAIVSPHTTGAQMQSLLKELQRALAVLALPHPSTPSRCVTLCAGVAAHTAQSGDVAENLVAAADQALYQAKLAGHNAVVLA
jgi:diguanylate cyclase (GGDEF)-like protein